MDQNQRTVIGTRERSQTNAALLALLQSLDEERTMTTPIKPSTANASSPLASLKIDHSAIRVPDFDTAVAWYAEKLDFRLRQSVSLPVLRSLFFIPPQTIVSTSSFWRAPAQTTGAPIKICMTATRCLAGTISVFVSKVSTRQSTNGSAAA